MTGVEHAKPGGRLRVAKAVRWGAAVGILAALGCALFIVSGATAKSNSKSADQLKMAVILHLRVPSLLQFGYGAQAAGKQYGFKVDVVGPQKINTLQQQQMVNSEVNNAGVKGVMPILIGAQAWTRTFKDLQKRGIRIVDIGVQTGRFMGAATPLLVAPRDIRTGRAAGGIIITRLGPNPSGEVVVDEGVPGLKICEDRFTGVKQIFAERAPNVKVIRVQVADDDVKGPIDWKAQIQAHPNALAFIGDCASTAPPILGKIKQETGAKWLVTGSELDPRVPPLIKSGAVAGVTSASFFLQGYVAARILYEQITHHKYLAYKGWIDSGTDVITQKNVDAVITALKSQGNLAKYYAPREKTLFSNLKAALGPY